MNFANFVVAPILVGLGLAVAWTVAWAFLLPAIDPHLAWSGYDSRPVITVVFLVGYCAQTWVTLRAGS